MIPLREAKLVPEQEQQCIFSNIEEIVAIHEQLLKKLKARLGVTDLAPSRENGYVFYYV